MMYLLTIVASTTEQHEEHGKIGDAYVHCWIRRDTEEEAIKIANHMIAEDGWKVLRTEDVSTVNESDYEDDDEHRPFYEQALSDNAVFVFNVCPKYSVYYINFEVRPKRGDANATEARVWMANEYVDREHDPMDLEFWTGDRLKNAISMATESLEENDFEVIKINEQHPCEYDENSENGEFFEAAEEDGICLVIVHEAPTEE